ADRITTFCWTQISLFYAAYSIEPLLFFDILLAIFLFLEFTRKVLESDLLYMHVYQLE
ncbi:uncharacterized protein BT62DRAFT_886045, partial [Guyanagaster necrorhizus]